MIESDNITEVLDGGVDRASGAPYLVMELLAGEDLDAAVKRLGPLRPELAARVVAQMLMGLERAHAAGVVHRDIKPANVFLAKKDGGAIVVKVGDFGVAKVKTNPLASNEDVALTQTSALLGSPIYMSPEQAKGARDIDARSDLWSTGVVLFQLLAGVTPHAHADTLGLLLLAICSGEAASVQSKAPWVPDALDAIVARALELDAGARYQSAREMLDAILSTLPDGVVLDESMFTSMTVEELTAVPPEAATAPSLAETALAPAADLAGRSGGREPMLALVLDPPLSSTETGVTRVSAAPPPATRATPPRRAIVVGAVVAAVAIGAGALALRSVGAREGETVASSTSATPSVAASSGAVAAAPSARVAPASSVVAASNVAGEGTATGAEAVASARRPSRETPDAAPKAAALLPRPSTRGSAAPIASPASSSGRATDTPTPAASPTGSLFRDFR